MIHLYYMLSRNRHVKSQNNRQLRLVQPENLQIIEAQQKFLTACEAFVFSCRSVQALFQGFKKFPSISALIVPTVASHNDYLVDTSCRSTTFLKEYDVSNTQQANYTNMNRVLFFVKTLITSHAFLLKSFF